MLLLNYLSLHNKSSEWCNNLFDRTLSGCSFELWEEYKAEAVVVVAIAGGVVVAVSRPAVLRIVVPTATAQHAVCSLDY